MIIKDWRPQTLCETEAQAQRAMAQLKARYGLRYDFMVERSDAPRGWMVLRADVCTMTTTPSGYITTPTTT